VICVCISVIVILLTVGNMSLVIYSRLCCIMDKVYYGSYLSFCMLCCSNKALKENDKEHKCLLGCWFSSSVVKTVEMMLIDRAGSGRRPPAYIIPPAKASKRLWVIKKCWLASAEG
jgi:hypothetical protein